jgi:recombination protein RecA
MFSTMQSERARLLSLVRPAPTPIRGAADWSLAGLAGRLCELSGGAAVTFAFRLIDEAQRAGEPAAWVGPPTSCFFPPDAADGGIDLDALVVVRTPDAPALARAADQLARSGAFGLLVLDLDGLPDARIPPPLLSRLLGLAQKHEVAMLFLTGVPLGSLVSLRAEALARRRAGAGPSTLDCELRVVKDKRRAPGWTFNEVCRGPAGLR